MNKKRVKHDNFKGIVDVISGYLHFEAGYTRFTR